MSKTHAKNMRVLFGGANLSGDSRDIGSIGLQHDTAEAFGFDATLKERLVGHADAMLGPLQALFNDTPAAIGPVEPGSHITLNAIGQPIASVFIGSGQAPAIGDVAYSMTTQQTSYTVTGTNTEAVIINADFTTRADSVFAGWGRALAVGASVSATTSLASVDNGAQTTAGGTAVLHVTQSVAAMGTNDWAITLEDSTNGSDWAALGTAFTADGSATTAELQTISGTIRRYVRAVATKTTGNDIIIWINLVRN